jgi:putative spermidine/putrescine transport system ATP-binding protein/spermidine/putrescine transport system ATP-binding protein
MSDRIAIMRNGVFEQVGARVDVYRKPATAFVAGFVGQSNHIDGIATEVGKSSVTLDWRGLPLDIPHQGGIAPGSKVRFSIKYEDVDILPRKSAINGHAAVNRLSGKLRDIIFKGQTANYIVLLDDGSEIVASRSPRDIKLEIGEEVVAQWAANAGMGFPA